MFLFHRCTVKSGAKHHPKLQDELGTVAIFPMIFSRFPCELGRFSLMSQTHPETWISRNWVKLGRRSLLIFVLSPQPKRCVAAFARNWHISIPSCVAPTAWCRSKSRQSRRMGRSRRVSSGNDMRMGPVTYEFAIFFWINIRTSSI